MGHANMCVSLFHAGLRVCQHACCVSRVGKDTAPATHHAPRTHVYTRIHGHKHANSHSHARRMHPTYPSSCVCFVDGVPVTSQLQCIRSAHTVRQAASPRAQQPPPSAHRNAARDDGTHKYEDDAAIQHLGEAIRRRRLVATHWGLETIPRPATPGWLERRRASERCRRRLPLTSSAT